ncbi:AAA family ATPase [Anoxybacillus flavithermus]|uniref:Predicted ATPase n=1 Tax=Anoxybacillus flavithermus (strain DSM 21510 / WK1) TaxID=491915 RepID=B7GLE2_ANOFW|nr:ATP-binding protein [Anoxybacillus flavithermus]ACJ34374.1 Predicted ATPase [Anoxybacillus flavithermus WK1]AST07803.1 ATPase [Anoxybacillus flavithermus]
MLIQFSCGNFKSIREKVTLSMLATKDGEHKECTMKIDEKIQLLPLVAIYGANGSGKSNVLQAIGFVKFLVNEADSFHEGDDIPILPHKLEEHRPSVFELQFIVNGVRYAYGFSITREKILEEYLYFFPNGRQARVFERLEEQYIFGNKFQKELDEIKRSKTRQNRLFLATAGVWSNAEEVKHAFLFLRNELVVNQFASNESWLHYTIDQISTNETNKNILLNMLNYFHIPVENIITKVEKKQLSYSDLPPHMPEELKMLLLKGSHVNYEVKLVYPNMTIHLSEESRGVQRLFEIMGPILDILSNGKCLVFDELETSLHPLLVLQIIKLFQTPKLNPKHAQLIFSTHDTNLLDLTILRRDQIWITEKNSASASTDLYSISDVKHVRKDENIEKGYMKGKYGGIPLIQTNFLNKWVEYIHE